MMLEIDIDADAEWDSSTDWAALAESAAEPRRESRVPAARRRPRAVELSVRFTGDEEVRALNAAMARQGQADQRPLLPDGRADELRASRR